MQCKITQHNRTVKIMSRNFTWRMAITLYNRVKALADKKGIKVAAMLNIIVNENIAKYEG